MSNLQAQITDAWKNAMRNKDTQQRDTLSTLRAAIKNAEIERKMSVGSLEDEDVLHVIEREAKKRRDAIEEYSRVGREDMAAREKAELDILATYLPEPLSEEEIQAIVQEVIEETGASGPAAMGTVMKAVLARVAGRADGKVVSNQVRQALTS